MDLTAFNRLPLDEKTNYMWDHGVCLAQRIVENRYILCIFELNGFYVEPFTADATTESMPSCPSLTCRNGKGM